MERAVLVKAPSFVRADVRDVTDVTDVYVISNIRNKIVGECDANF